MNYLQRKKLAFMSIVNQVKGFVRSVSGTLPLTLEGCVDEESIIEYKIYGQSVQDGEPTPNNPIEVKSVGDRTVNLFDIDSVSGMSAFSSALNSYYSISDEIIRNKWGAYAGFAYFKCNIKTLTAGQYVLKFDASCEGVDSAYYGLGFTDKTSIYSYTDNISEWTTISYEFELTDDKEIFGIQLQGAGNAENFRDVKCYFKNVMLCKKSDDTGVYEPYGKYKIPITVNGSGEPITTNIYLDKPLGQGEAISYKKDSLPTIPTHKGTSIITAGTIIQPSQAEIEYYSNVKE